MNILHYPPPIYEELVLRFGVDFENICITYGDTIYSKYAIRSDVLVHEKVHLRQQNYSNEVAEKWWRKYLDDPMFRLSQEVEAYKAQYQYLKRNVKDRNSLHRFLYRLAEDVSGDMYGKLLTQSEAMRIIKS